MVLHIGLNAGIFSGQDPEGAIVATRQAGAEGCELNVAESGPLGLDTSGEEIRRLRHVAEAQGVALPSIHCGLHWRHPLSDPDPEVRQRGVAALARTLEIGAELGAGVLLVVPGVVTARVPYADAYARAQESVALLGSRASTLGMRVGVENVWNRFLLSPLETARFIDEIGQDSVGAYFDVGNVLAFGYPQHWIATLGRRILAVHFKDYRSDVAGMGGFVYLLQGDVAWRECVQGLQAVGYEGFVTAELGPYRHLPERTAPDTVAAMRAILAMGG